MAELEKGKSVSLEELMVSTLAMTDALAKLLIEKGVITDAKFKQKLLETRKNHLSRECGLSALRAGGAMLTEAKEIRSYQYQIFMLALCLYALGALGTQSILALDPPLGVSSIMPIMLCVESFFWISS